MREYQEEDYLLLSGIQHFAFCPRQWALIHIEDQWTENYLTASGRILHEKAHDGSKFEKRGSVITFRALKVSSPKLGISGECDIVEFHADKNGIPLNNYDGCFIPYPVEYKRGKSKIDDCDRLQLSAQAMCLEYMLNCDIPEGALFYGESKRREVVVFTKELREELEGVVETMHSLFEKKHTPKSIIGKKCMSCSLKNECVPKISRTEKSVQKYLEDGLS